MNNEHLEFLAESSHSRLRGWGLLAFFIMLLWAFIAIIGPWGEEHIPVFSDIVKVIEEQDINANAYFYTEIEATNSAERYLSESIAFAGHRDTHFNLVFMLVLFLSLAILVLGFCFMPE